MKTKETQIVTGAFGYSGGYIAKRLIEQGKIVKTLTNSPKRKHSLNNSVEALPLCFNDKSRLVTSLKGCDVLFNTYWVRFNHKRFVHSEAVENTLILFECAKIAKVRKIIHISITNPDKNSDLEYFSGKAILEDALVQSGMSYSILRPTVLFGKEDILINNIAWCLRKLPVFGIFGDGNYKLQPIYVDDLAELAVAKSEEKGNSILDAIGPETFTFRELVEIMNRELGLHKKIIPVSPITGFLASKLLGLITKDELVTWPEIEGLMRNLLFTNSKPTGKTHFTQWVKENAPNLGRRYANEVKRRDNRLKEYL